MRHYCGGCSGGGSARGDDDVRGGRFGSESANWESVQLESVRAFRVGVTK